MIDADAARELARQALRHSEDDGGVRCVLVGESLHDGSWWVQGYQSDAFAVLGDVFRAFAGEESRGDVKRSRVHAAMTHRSLPTITKRG